MVSLNYLLTCFQFGTVSKQHNRLVRHLGSSSRNGRLLADDDDEDKIVTVLSTPPKFKAFGAEFRTSHVFSHASRIETVLNSNIN